MSPVIALTPLFRWWPTGCLGHVELYAGREEVQSLASKCLLKVSVAGAETARGDHVAWVLRPIAAGDCRPAAVSVVFRGERRTRIAPDGVKHCGRHRTTTGLVRPKVLLGVPSLPLSYSRGLLAFSGSFRKPAGNVVVRCLIRADVFSHGGLQNDWGSVSRLSPLWPGWSRRQESQLPCRGSVRRLNLT